MPAPLELHPDRLFPPDAGVRDIARELYEQVKGLPIISPHGHVDPALLADNEPFSDPAWLLIIPDHYVHRMLRSTGMTLGELGVPDVDGNREETDSRKIWRSLCENWHLFRATPTRFWIEQELVEVFDVTIPISSETADDVYDALTERIADPDYLPRAMFDRFNIEALATTDEATDTLDAHKRLQESGWDAKIVPTFRPDKVVDFDKPGFAQSVAELGELTGKDTRDLTQYLEALVERRQAFIAMGATATDHGHPTAHTCELSAKQAQDLLTKGLAGEASPEEAEAFRGHMLMELAAMSREDGLVMQLHIGSFRDHDAELAKRYGPDKGADIPMASDYVRGLRPLLNRHGTDPEFRLVLFTLDETTYARELAPIAGYYPAVKLGPAWWFYDSPDGMRRYRDLVTETAGFYNTSGFNDDTRAFPSIPVRHDVSRRIDCGYLAGLVAEHRLPLDEAHATAADLAYHLAKDTYKL